MFISLLFIGELSFGQQRIGVLVGPTITHISSDFAKYNVRVGFSAGLSYTIFMGHFFSISTNICYERKGFGYQIMDSVGRGVREINKLDYLVIPALIRFGHNIFVTFGPYMGLLLNHSKEYKDPNISGTQNSNKVFKTIDAGLTVGLGVQLLRGFSIEARNNIGLSDISKLQEINKTYSGNLLFGITFNVNPGSGKKILKNMYNIDAPPI